MIDVKITFKVRELDANINLNTFTEKLSSFFDDLNLEGVVKVVIKKTNEKKTDETYTPF